MKRFAILAAVVALIGCTQNNEGLDNITNIPLKSQTEFYASMPECDTRTYVEDNKYLRWNAGDEITVFAGNSYNGHWQFAGEDGANSGKFNEVDEGGFVTGTPLDLTANYAIYPYDENITITEAGVVSLTLPAVQAYNHTYANSFGAGANTMMAVTKSTADNFLSFKNLCGYLKLKFYGEDVTVKSVTVKGNNSEKIAGKATVSMAYGGEPTITMGDDATDTITIDCGEGVALSNDAANPTTFWVVIPEITFEGGITIEVTDINNQTFSKQTTNAVPIENNLIQPMATLGVETAPAVVKPANNEIWYTNGSATEATTPYKTDVFGANIVSNTYDAEKECWVIKFDGDVTSIGDNAFSDRRSLTSITIPDSVTSIGSSAFYNCSSLTTITIPDSVTSIGSYAFQYCTGELIVNCNIPSASGYKYGAFYYSEFTSVTIGDSVTTIGDYAFHNCSRLTTITIPDSVTSIGSFAFCGCSSLTSVTIPDSVTSIGSSAFSGCSSLTSVTIPDSVTSIGRSAFSGCSSLMSITIPDGVTSIGTLAFNNCSSLTSVTIPDSVTSIGYATFAGCSSLTSVTIGNSVTTIGDSAFSGCSSLTNITIPDGVSEIGYAAFEDCSSLTSITIPDSVTSIGSSAFRGCSGLIEFKGKLASEDGRCIIIEGELKSFAKSGLTEYTIPDSVTSIGSSAFRGCSSLTSVTIPDNVTTIGDYAFYGCGKLTSITIPDDVTFIGSYAFSTCWALTSVYCKPKTPPTSNDYMFYENASDRKIYVPINSVDAYMSNGYWGDYGSAIQGYNFAAMELSRPANNEIWYTNGGSTQATTPNKTDVFGANIVSNTYDTEKECWVIKFDGKVTMIGDSAFYNCDSLTSITIPDSVTSIGTLAFSSCNNLQSPIILDSVTTIGDRAFAYCDSLTSITIPDSVTTIKWETFRGCSSLASITIPNSVTLIEFRAFYGCSSLTSIIIPNSVTSIRENTFGECSSLYGITIPNSVTEIRGGAFISCHNLQYVNLPNSLTTIGSAAFRWCHSLTHITIPESVTSIGELAFDGCSDLTDVNCKATTPPTGGSGMFYSYSEDEYLWPHIYVPYNSVSAYKSAEYWKDYASQISADPLSAY